MFQIIDDYQEELETRPEFISIELLLDYFIHEISSRNNFEFVQAVIRLFLKVWIHHCSFVHFSAHFRAIFLPIFSFPLVRDNIELSLKSTKSRTIKFVFPLLY